MCTQLAAQLILYWWENLDDKGYDDVMELLKYLQRSDYC